MPIPPEDVGRKSWYNHSGKSGTLGDLRAFVENAADWPDDVPVSGYVSGPGMDAAFRGSLIGLMADRTLGFENGASDT